MKQKIIKYYNDARHGWMAVKRKELADLGILDKITVYSYQRGATVYLEDHSDASLYINTMKARGFEFMFGNNSAIFDGTPEDKLIRVVSKYTESSPIRSYDSFSVDMQ